MALATGKEQELLELLNRLRMYPDVELDILINSLDPYVRYALLDYYRVDLARLQAQWKELESAAPLAWNSQLNDAATNHNREMIKQDVQAHTLPGQLSLGDRLAAAGYQANFYGENVYGSALGILFAHAGLAIDWGQGNNAQGGIQTPAKHRNTMMSSAAREVGISVIEENNDNTKIGPLVITQDFANRQAIADKGWLLGVAFEDKNQDGWYQDGEGLTDVEVQVTGIDGTDFNTKFVVADTGSYQELLNPGKYRVDFVRNGQTVSSQTTAIDARKPQNIKVDLVLPVQTLGSNLQTNGRETNLLDFRTQNNGDGSQQSLNGKTISAKTVGVTGDAYYHNYVGIYRVENTQGMVIDPLDNKSYLPGDRGYLEAALRRSQERETGVSFDRQNTPDRVNLQGGYIYAPFIIANGSVEDVLNSPNNSSPQVYFNYLAANADNVEHIQMLSPNKFGFEDTFGGGDRDYNDLIFQVVAEIV
jgi:hypothetical protein